MLAEGVDADLVDEHLDAGAGAVDAQEVLAVEDPHARLGDLQVVAVVELDELVERRRDPGHDRGAAADPDLDAAHAVALARDERHVVDAGDRVVVVGGGERRLDLARHRLRRGMTDEVAHVGAGVGGDVEQLVVKHAGAGIAGDVAHRVAAALAGGQAGVGELAHQRGGVGQRDVVHLDVLAGRDVALAQRHVLLDHVGEGLELVGRDAAHRQLDADHLHVGLALAVDALLEAELDELRLRSSFPSRYRVDSVSKSSNSRSRIGITCPGTFSTTSGFSSDPCAGTALGVKRAGLHRLPLGQTARARPTKLPKGNRDIGFSLAGAPAPTASRPHRGRRARPTSRAAPAPASGPRPRAAPPAARGRAGARRATGGGAVSRMNRSRAATTAAASSAEAPGAMIDSCGRRFIAASEVSCAAVPTLPVLDHDAVLQAVTPQAAIERVREAFAAPPRGDWAMPAKVYLRARPTATSARCPRAATGWPC